VHPETRKIQINRIVDFTICLGIVIFSFYLCFRSGAKGFFPIDQSIVFDGGYRICSGQVPYKDFVIPFGPVVFWLQAVFFKLFGTNYFSYMLHAALINSLAVISSIGAIRLILGPYGKWLSYLGGGLTAVWFYAPCGTPWMDQTGFFFVLIAIGLLLGVLIVKDKNSVTSNVLILFSGCFAVLSFLSKQNVGLFMVPLYLLLLTLIYMPDRRKVYGSIAVFLLGGAISVIVFLIWLFTSSNMENFFQYVFKIPLFLGRERLFGQGILPLFKNLFLGKGPITWQARNVTFIVIGITTFFAYFSNFKNGKAVWRKQLIAAILCVYLIFYQNIFNYCTLNQFTNGNIFTGIIFAVIIGLMLDLLSFVSQRIKKAYYAHGLKVAIIAMICLTGISTAASFRDGILVSLSRHVHDIFAGTIFPNNLQIEKLKQLKWAQPTEIWNLAISEESTEKWNAEIREKHLVELYNYLEKEDKNFFIFPDLTILYGVLNAPSPQPLLWFHQGVTYPKRYDQKLDEWIVKDLVENKVEIIVIEEVSIFGTTGRLNNFPRLRTYIEGKYKKVKKIGIFDIYKKEKEEI